MMMMTNDIILYNIMNGNGGRETHTTEGKHTSSTNTKPTRKQKQKDG